jgi:hypothetical protein
MRPIERNIPIPIPSKRQPIVGKRGKYPWHLMEVGDSFTTDAGMNTILALTVYQKKKYGGTFTARQIDAATVRVWRIA